MVYNSQVLRTASDFCTILFWVSWKFQAMVFSFGSFLKLCSVGTLSSEMTTTIFLGKKRRLLALMQMVIRCSRVVAKFIEYISVKVHA